MEEVKKRGRPKKYNNEEEKKEAIRLSKNKYHHNNKDDINLKKREALRTYNLLLQGKLIIAE